MISKLTWLGLLMSAVFTQVNAQSITTTVVRDNLYMLSGKGGNIGVMVGEDGTFMIDDQFAPAAPALMKAIEALGAEKPRFLINTHFHGDHTGGNEIFGNHGAVIVAHANVRRRLSSETFIEAFGMTTPPQPPAALPVVTFTADIQFHLNGDTISVIHPANAHTDGDAFIHFESANVIHAGDLWFNGFFPFIDTDNGGSLHGLIQAVDQLLSRSDTETKIIPGHGPLGDRTALQAYRAMLADAYDRLSALKASGQSLEAVKAAEPLKDLQSEWGNAIFNHTRWVEIVWDTL